MDIYLKRSALAIPDTVTLVTSKYLSHRLLFFSI